jgi:hypothetical protein
MFLSEIFFIEIQSSKGIANIIPCILVGAIIKAANSVNAESILMLLNPKKSLYL